MAGKKFTANGDTNQGRVQWNNGENIFLVKESWPAPIPAKSTQLVKEWALPLYVYRHGKDRPEFQPANRALGAIIKVSFGLSHCQHAGEGRGITADGRCCLLCALVL